MNFSFFFYKGLSKLYTATRLQGDAGLRSYYRIKTSDKSYILMNCPPTYCRIDPFIEIADYLRSQNFSSPEIFHFDSEKGFIILEDFGDVSVKNVIQNSPHDLHLRKNIYSSMLDALILLQQNLPGFSLKIYDNNLLLNELNCLVLRDYHFENIMYLESYKGIKSLGLLDFQDAIIGSPIYDVISV
jgi:N-acetylmuramate 1-kinase